MGIKVETNWPRPRTILTVAVTIWLVVAPTVAAAGPAVDRLDRPGSSEAGETLYVGAGSSSYDSIQRAVDDATAGDRVVVRSGTYEEWVVVSKSISLVAKDGARLQGDERGNAITVKEARGVTVAGFEIRGYRIGVEVDASSAVTVRDVSVRRSATGVSVVGSSDVTVDTVDASRLEANGVEGIRSTGVTVTNSRLANNGFDGVIFQAVDRGRVVDNHLAGNERQNVDVHAGSGNRVIGNDVDGGQVGIWTLDAPETVIEDNEIANTGWGVYVQRTNDSVLTSNQIRKTKTNGIVVLNSRKVSVRENVATGNAYDGILAKTVTTLHVVANVVSDNRRDGIDLETVDDVRVASNEVRGNDNDGVELATTRNVALSNNTIDDNGADGIRIQTAATNLEIVDNEITGNANFGLDVTTEVESIAASGNVFRNGRNLRAVGGPYDWAPEETGRQDIESVNEWTSTTETTTSTTRTATTTTTATTKTTATTAPTTTQATTTAGTPVDPRVTPEGDRAGTNETGGAGATVDDGSGGGGDWSGMETLWGVVLGANAVAVALVGYVLSRLYDLRQELRRAAYAIGGVGLFAAGIVSIGLLSVPASRVSLGALTVVGTSIAMTALVAAGSHRVLGVASGSGDGHSVIDDVEDPFLVLDDQQRVTRYNEASVELLDGVEPGARFERLLPDVEHVENDAEGETTAKVVFPDRDENSHFLLQISTTSGTEATAIDTTYEEEEKYVVRMVDVTDIERRRQRLEAKSDALEQKNEQLDQFASTVSHDLRNPISVADGYAEILRSDITARDDVDAEEIESHLDKIENALERMDTIIEDSLTLARQGDHIDEVRQVSLESIARDAWGNVDTHRATLRVAADGILKADQERLLRVFENLYRNAIEHAGEDATVHVGIHDGGFYVADDGPGIPEDRRDTVFDYGYTTESDGTGFGLAIVDAIAQAHGWRVTVSPEHDGACFVFSDVAVGERAGGS